MDRRQFLENAAHIATILGISSLLEKVVWAETIQEGKAISVKVAPAGPVQSERGVVVHPYSSRITHNGLASDGTRLKPEDFVETDPEKVRWQLQNTRSVRPTHRIWRGNGPVSVYARPKNAEEVREAFDQIVFPTREGKQTTLRKYYREHDVQLVLGN